MLRGDLAITRLDEVLRLLADDRATGRLAVDEGGRGARARTAEIFVADGDIYAAWVAEPDADPLLAADARLRLRLLAAGTLRQEAWEEAIIAQEELFDWSIGELLVELGHLDRASLERVATEELLDAVTQSSGWSFGSFRFRRRERARNRAGRTYTVSELLEAVTQRRLERERLGVPADAVASPGDGAAEAGGLEAAVLGLVDGGRSVAEIAAGCGCTGFEVAGILRSLADRGYVMLPAPAADVAPQDEQPNVADQDDPLDPVSRWSALLDATLPPAVVAHEPRATVERVRSDLPPRPVEELDPETAQRRARLRARAAEELLAAQAEAEALREAEVARAALALGISVVENPAALESADLPEEAAPEQASAADPAHGESKSDAPEAHQDATVVALPDAGEFDTGDVEPGDVEPADASAAQAVEEPDEEHDPALAAALLRELSSLGVEDELAPGPRRGSRIPVPRHAATPSRKKRGLFGR